MAGHHESEFVMKYSPKRSLILPTIILVWLGACAVPFESLPSEQGPVEAEQSSPELLETGFLAASGQAAPVQPTGLPLTELADGVFEQPRFVHELVQRLLQDCMQDAGFSYDQVPYEVVASPAPSTYGDGTLALEDSTSAARVGYAKPSSPADEEWGGQNPATKSLSQGELEAWGGAFFGEERLSIGNSTTISAGGCLDKAESAIYPDRARYHGLQLTMQLILADAVTMTLRDKEVVDAMTAWSACMADQGFAATDPGEARTSYGQDTDSAPAALAEVDCNQKTGLNSAARLAAAPIQQGLVQENRATIDAWRDLLQIARVNALTRIAAIDIDQRAR